MYNYDPLWKTMKKKGVSQYQLIRDYQFSTGMLDTLRKNKNVTVNTIDFLCQILDCTPNDIIEVYREEEISEEENKE